jgi:hypothetical protein
VAAATVSAQRIAVVHALAVAFVLVGEPDENLPMAGAGAHQHPRVFPASS